MARWIVALWLAVAVAGAGAQELTLRETPQGSVCGTEQFAVRFDPQTGWAGEVLCDGQVVVKAADTPQAFDILHDAKWVTGAGAKIERLGVERVAPDTAKSRMKAGEWSVDACLQLFPERRMVRRWFEISWLGAADAKIKGFWIQGGVLPLNESGGYLLPAHYPPHRTAATELVANRKSGSGSSPIR